VNLRKPSDVAWVAQDEGGDHPQVFLMRVPSDPPIVLEEWAALIWLAAVRGDLDEAWIAELPSQELRDSVDGFVDDLVTRGLLEHQDQP